MLAADPDARGLTSLGLVVAGAGLFVLAALATSYAQPLLLGLLSILAASGVFFMFAFAAGHIRIGERLPQSDIATLIADDLDEGMHLTTARGETVWANRRAMSLFSQASLADLAAIESALGGGKQVSQHLFRLMRAAEQMRPAQETIRVNMANDALGPRNAITHLQISVAPFQVPGRERETGPLVLWRVRDVSSERARINDAMSALVSTLSLYDNLPVGLVAARSDGSLQHINATMAEWLGLNAGDRTAGQPVRLNELLPADGAELLLSRAAAEPTGKPPESIELDLIRDDGRMLPVRVLVSRIRAVPGGHDEETIVIAALNREAEDAGLDTKAASGIRASRVFRAAPFGIATVGTDGRIVSTNAAFSRMIVDGTSGIGDMAEDVLTRNADEELQMQVSAGLEKVLDGRGNVTPVDICAGETSEFTRRVYMSPLTRASQTREAAILYVIDITEQKALEAKFAQSQKMEAVGKLAGFVAHDFNNMLTAIIGFSDFLLQTHRPTDPAHADIINIKSSANRAAGLVGKLLALARQQTLLVEPLQLGEVMTDLAPLLKRSIGEKIELKLSSGRDLWYVKTDKLQLEQAIINLAVNARDAMAETGGRLTIRTRNVIERETQKLQPKGMQVGEYVLIEIEDTGSGIPSAVLEKIFEPFFTTKAAGKGTGLGLATVYGIVKQTGGYIYPDSTEGKGTTFRIYLPRYHLDERDEAQMQDKANEAAEVDRIDLTGNGRVLLVEDEDVVRSFAVRALTRQGYEVLQAGDGREALEVMAANNGAIDIVVSDVVMPEMDGPTMLKEMRKTRPDLKIIFVSGYPNEAFQQALGEETFAFLPKPFSLPQLAAKVKEQLGR